MVNGAYNDNGDDDDDHDDDADGDYDNWTELNYNALYIVSKK